MNTKLTLKLDGSVVERAKNYARGKKTSLSKLIEAYLSSITGEDEKQDDISPLVQSLSGVVKLPKDYNSKKDYTRYLNKKYE
jgi:hypothetical protein